MKRNNESNFLDKTWKNVLFRLCKILFNVLFFLLTVFALRLILISDKGFELSLMIEIQQLIEIYIPRDLIITTIYDSILQNLRSIYSALYINLIFKVQRKSRYTLTLRSTTNHSPCVSASRYAVTHRFRNLLTNIASFTESEPDPMI